VWRDGSWRVLGAARVTLIANGGERRFETGAAIEGLPKPGS
jgi:hypothetical protein